MDKEYNRRLLIAKSQADALSKELGRLLSAPEGKAPKILPERKRDLMNAVVEEVCKYAMIKEKDLLRGHRYGYYMTFRKIACYLLMDYCGATLQEAADRLNLTSHATVKSHSDKLRWWMENKNQAPRDLLVATVNIINNVGLND